eukprot:3541714-Amphidinium_carterae.1
MRSWEPVADRTRFFRNTASISPHIQTQKLSSYAAGATRPTDDDDDDDEREEGALCTTAVVNVNIP